MQSVRSRLLAPCAAVAPGSRAAARSAVAACVAVSVAFGGCATYRPAPISPAATAAAFESRTLEDTGLRAFIQRNVKREVPQWPPAQWDVELLTLAAYYFHPDLDVARAKWGVAQAGVVTAGMRPNPTITAGAQFNANTPQGTSPWTLGLNLDIPIETAGKRGYRLAQANYLSEAARLAIAGAASLVRSRVRGALLDLQSARQTHAVLLQQRQLQQDQVALLERRLALGMASTPEVTQARIALNQSVLALDDAERARSDAHARLASALGLSGKALDQVAIAPNLFAEFPAAPSDEMRTRALLNRADVLAALAEYAASQSALQLEIANQYPDIHLGPGYSWDQGARKWSVGLSVALPIMNQNQGPIAEARARRIQAAAAFNSAQARAIGEIEAAFAGYRASRNKLVSVQALQDAQAALLRKAEASFKAGETDRGTLLGAQLEAAHVALSRVDALAKAQQALGALEDAVLPPLPAPESVAASIQDNPRQTKEKDR